MPKIGGVRCVRYSVLLANENRDEAKAIQKALENVGLDAQVNWIKRGDELIQFLEDKRQEFPLTSVLLLDANLPEKNGFDVLKWITSQRDLRRLFIVMLVQENDRQTVDKAYQMGANSFLSKPVKALDAQNLVDFLNGYWLLTRDALA